MAALFGWLALSVLVGFVASSKGHSALAFIFLSLVFSPLVGLIVAAIVAPRGNALRAPVARPTPEAIPYTQEAPPAVEGAPNNSKPWWVVVLVVLGILYVWGCVAFNCHQELGGGEPFSYTHPADTNSIQYYHSTNR